MTNLRIASAVLAVLVPQAARADDLAANLDRVIPALMAEYEVPGVAVAVVEDGRVTAMRGYGFADKAQRRNVTPDTLFNIGSVSKTFSAWGVLRLASEKDLDLDASVWRYIHRWHLPASDFDQNKVTIRRLLSHTAGLSVHGYAGWTSLDQRPSLLDALSGAVKGTEPVKLVSEPGARWSYSGGGYSVAQLLIEEQSGESFATYFAKDVFPAMGLTESTFAVDAEVLDRASRAYDEQGRLIPTRVFTAQAAAGLMTTARDMARFEILTMRNGVAADGTAVLPANLMAELTKPEVASMPFERFPEEPRLFGMDEPKSGKHQSFGLGYHLYRLPDGREIIGHTGANIGWRAGLMMVPKTGQGIVVLTNAAGGADVRGQIFCYWRRHLDGKIRPKDCPVSIVARLKKAYGRGGIEQVLAGFKDKTQAGLSDETLVEVVYEIASLQPDKASARSPLSDSIRLLELNLKNYPKSAATLVGLAQLCIYTGDLAKAQAYAKEALALDISEGERADMEIVLAKKG